MATSCARPACNLPAVATYNFDGLKRIVWLSPLDEGGGRSAGDLCQKHADRLRAPLHWELHDLRDATPTSVHPIGSRTQPSGATPMLERAFRASKAG
jgi:hypothetical protein